MAKINRLSFEIALSTAVFFLLIGCSPTRDSVAYVREDKTEVRCPIPPDEVVITEANLRANADVYKLGEIINAEISLERKVEKIREVMPGTQTFEVLSYHVCALYGNDVIDKNGYKEFFSDILRALHKTAKVAIDRVADFRNSGCIGGEPVDVAIFEDTVSFMAGREEYYRAYAEEGPGSSVQVFDLNVSEENPVRPSVESVNEVNRKTFLISIGDDQKAKIRYVWKNAHSIENTGGIAITSRYFLSQASGFVRVPESVSIIPLKLEPVEHCVQEGPASFSCRNLNDPFAVQFHFRWDIWANCLRS